MYKLTKSRLMMIKFSYLLAFYVLVDIYSSRYMAHAQTPNNAPQSKKSLSEQRASDAQPTVSKTQANVDQERSETIKSGLALSEQVINSECKESPLKSKLKGIYIGNRKRDSYARIRMNNSTHTYRIGHQLSDRELVGIQWGRVSPRVILQINGQQECLSLQTSYDAYVSSQLQKEQDAPIKSKTPLNNDIVKEIEPNHFLIDRSQLPSLEYEDLLRQARIIPNYKAGQQIGLRVIGVRPNALIYKLGVRSGDIFVSINQIKLSTLNKLFEAYDDIVAKANQPVSAELIRRGQVRSFKWTSQ